MWGWLRLGWGVLILAVLLLHVGADPFVAGLHHTTPAAVGAALAVTIVTTVCCAWRWSRVVGRLGVDLPLRYAVAAYYRSQFVNATLPGGVLGDVHRAVRHGRHAGRLGLGVRGVAWERAIGLGVYITGAVTIAALTPSLRAFALVLGAMVAVGALAALALPLLVRRSARWGRRLRSVAADAREILGAGGLRWGLLAVSLVTAAGHTAIFVLAARSAGVERPALELVPVAMVVLVGSTVPTNLAGWGPREATAAGAFASVGLSADQGVTVAVVYGVLALVATLPGAVLLLVRRAAPVMRGTDSSVTTPPAAGIDIVPVGGATHG